MSVDASGASGGGNGAAGGGAGTGTGADGGAPAAGGGGSSASWYGEVDGDLKGYIENKGWKGGADVVQGYRNLEKLVGVPQERLLKLPDKDDAPEWGDVYNRLGRPETPDGYKLPVPEGGDPEFAKAASGWFHEAGLSAKQAVKVTEAWNKHMAEVVAQRDQQYQAQVQKDEGDLKREWGAAYDKHVQVAQAAARAFGLDAETIDKLEESMGFGKLMKFMHGIGSKLGEDSFETGQGQSGFSLTPDAARNRIEALKKDEAWVQKYVNGDMEARNELERLLKLANPPA